MRCPHLAAAAAIAALVVAGPANAKPGSGKCPKDPNPPTTRWLLKEVGTDKLLSGVDLAGNNNGWACELADPVIAERHVIDDIAK
jgi:hypothetical protein